MGKPAVRHCAAPARDGIRRSEYLDGADGDQMFRHACKVGLWHRRKTAESALSVRALAGLDQGEEPGCTGGDEDD
jgi:hypothetical protein